MAGPAIEEILINAQIGCDRLATWPIQQIGCSPRPVPPMLTVDFPHAGCRFVLESRMGLLQWFIETRPGWQGVVIQHDFYALDLVCIPDKVLNLLKNLQGYHFPLNPLCKSFPSHSHYRCNILITIKKGFVGQEGSLTSYTRHTVCSTAKLRDVFISVSGDGLDDEFALQHLVWDHTHDIFEERKIYTYEEAHTGKLELPWGNSTEIWLLPLRRGRDFVRVRGRLIY